MTGSGSPPLIYMNMHAGTSDADEGSTPQWVWLMVAGAVILTAFGIGMYYLLNTAY